MVKALNSAGITPILSLNNVHATACQGLACAPPKICAVPEEDVVAALKGLCDDGLLKPAVVKKAITDLGINPDRPDPVTL